MECLSHGNKKHSTRGKRISSGYIPKQEIIGNISKVLNKVAKLAFQKVSSIYIPTRSIRDLTTGIMVVASSFSFFSEMKQLYRKIMLNCEML